MSHGKRNLGTEVLVSPRVHTQSLVQWDSQLDQLLTENENTVLEFPNEKILQVKVTVFYKGTKNKKETYEIKS